MKTNKLFGWFIAILGIFLLLLGIMSDARINLGPLNYLYSLLDYISIRNIISIMAESISFFFKTIGNYFFYILLILIGITIIFGNKGINNDTFNFDEQGRPYTKKLRRGYKNRKIMGVCSGLSQYLNIDVSFIRILFLFLFFTAGGTPAFIYIILAIIMPESNEF